MVVQYHLGHVLLVLVAAVVPALLYWIGFVRLKWNEKFALLCLLPGAVVWIIAESSTNQLVIVDKGLGIHRKMAFFEPDYVADDGQKMKISRETPGVESNFRVFIVNSSDTALGVEAIAYGSLVSNRKVADDILPPHRTMKSSGAPDYYPDDTPSSSVSAGKGEQLVFKYWLRKVRPEEIAAVKNVERWLVPMK
jgi:hypothetical protein